MGEQRSRLRLWRPPQQSGHRQGVFFSLPSFGLGAFLTLPRAKPDDTAAERRSISASRNALAINVILKAAMASPPQIASAHLRSHRRRSGIDLRNRFTALTRFFRSEQTGGGHARRYSHPRFPNAERSTPGGHTIHPSDSGRRASERPPCCHKESAAAYL